MGISIAIFNQKGGVGKTTTNVNLSATLASKGKKICVVDIDPQGNSTSGFGVDKKSLEYTVYDVLINEMDIREVIIPTEYENLDLLPSSTQLAGAEVELTGMKRREVVLRNALQTIQDDYDYIFVDCPPSLGLLTINSLAAVDRILIPIQCEYYALEGVSQLMNTYQMVKKNLNPNLSIQGVVLMMFDGRTNLSIQVVEEVKKVFRGKVYVTMIPRNIRLAEAPSHGQPVIYYDPRSRGAEAFMELAEEFIDLEEGEW
ncbi:ParA family protein [Tindallia californiensis]|uniref:Sporulation initiation inhibitor protein Soj n=1 Tax=Tindallia californiensis TaxID=159292 RepID=A0A1H3QIT2_9FIRM|nr:AAA family ATPase [Tindallia californiensis]SDZ13514.1 chromosome partitioning protein [Tindallia californiensis]